ncbi:MAG: hypothetical protein AAGM21_09800 [Pseudomonadota bacterium]
MDAVISRLRIAERIEFFQQNTTKFAGFLAGALGTLVLSILFSVVYTGQGYGTAPDPVPQVYTNF